MLAKSHLELPQGEWLAEALPALTPPSDLDGFSSLLLLSTAASGRAVLYLLAWNETLLITTDIERPRVLRTTVRGWTRLPVQDDAVDLVVVDFDVVPRRAAVRRAFLTEVRRVLRPSGLIIAVLSHRRIPRNRRDVLRYRILPPLASWVRLIGLAGLTQASTALLQFDGKRLIEITWPLEPDVKTALPRGNAAAIVLSRAAASEAPSALTMLLRAVEAQMGSGVRLEQCVVRKIGKTALFLFADNSRRLLLRVARSPIALERARRNFDALTAVRRAEWISEQDREVVPRPTLAGRVGAYPFYVETVVRGRRRQARLRSGLAWEPDALRFITMLHRATAARTVVTVDVCERLVRVPIETIARWCGDADGRATLARLASVLSDHVIDRELPFVRSHGDFTADNCLYEDDRLSGVVDWELSSAQALPLLDLLQLMEIAGESDGHPRWQRADIVLDAARERGPLKGAAVIEEYVAAMGIDRTLVPTLLLMHWVDHVSSRIEARASDAGWVRRRVRQPLERLREILGELR